MKIKRTIAALLCTAMVASIAPVWASDETVFANYQFESTLTNKTPDYIQVQGGSARVVDIDTKNKALLMDENCAKFYTETGQLTNGIVISMDLKGNTDTVTANIGFSSALNQAVAKLVVIDKNTLKTTDGMEFGAITDRAFTNLTVVLNSRNMIDIYVDGNCKVKQWKNSATLGKGMMVEKTAGGLLIDNFSVYTGKNTEKEFEKESLLNDGEAYFRYDYFSNADMALVDTENLRDIDWASNGLYPSSGIAEKGNKITLNRMEQRLNPNRENGYLIFEKTNTSDVHYDFYTLNSSDAQMAGYFPYYYYEGNLMVERFGSPIKFAYFRDAITTGGNTDINAAYINGSGQVISYSGKAVKTLKTGEWMNYRFVFDIANFSCDFYIENELVDTFSYTQNFKRPTMLRIWIDVGGGSTKVTYDKLKVLGMRHPYDPENPDYHPSFFSSDDGIEGFLKDKTAFYAYSENVFANGEKHIRVAKPIKDDNETEVYVPVKSLSLGYGFDLKTDANSKTAKDERLTLTANSDKVTYEGKEYTLKSACKWENDTLYVPVDSFAEDVLGHCVKNDGNGLVITAKDAFYLNETEDTPDYLISCSTRWEGYYSNPVTPIKALNWYMSFERPEAETIAEDFNEQTNNGTQHPRVIASKEDFDRIRALKDTDEVMKKIVDPIIQHATDALNTTPFVYEIPDKQRLLNTARSYHAQLLPLGFAYQVTGEEKYAAKVWEMFETVLNFPDWNPSHMIDTGELVGAVSAAYDWCYDYFTPEQRQWIYERVKALGMKPIADAQKDIIYTRREWAGANDFVASKSNFNTVINGGQLCGLTAFAEMEPEFTFDAIKETMRSIEYSTLVYRPAGLWIESPSYWTYAAQYFSKGIGSLYNSTGRHYGLLDGQGIDRTGTWIAGMNSYGGLNNFHDAGAGKLATPYPGWFAKIYDIPALSAFTVNQVVHGERRPSLEDAFWYIPGNTATEEDLPMDIWAAGFDSVSSHASYSDKDALFFSTHGGNVICYHSQFDVGTFVLDLMGTRWVEDLGSDDYNVRRDQKAFGKMYRDIAEGHSVMVFDNNVPGQDIDGSATMTRWESKEKGCIAAYDMTSVYKDQVSAAQRGFYVGDNRRSLTVRDEFTAKSDMQAHWFIQTAAEVEIVDNNTAILKRAGQKLKMEVVTDVEDYKLLVGDAKPLPSSPNIQGQNPNNGYSRINLEMNLKGNKAQHITVKFSPYFEETENISAMNKPISEWQLPDGAFVKNEPMNVTIYVNGNPIDNVLTNGKLSVVEGEAMPEITGVPENPNHTVEVLPYQEGDDFIRVRVYNADKSRYKDHGIALNISKSTDISGLKEIPVVDVVVSSTPEEQNVKENMFDNDYTTRWTSNNATGETAIFDLGERKSISKIGMAFWRGNIRSYYYTLFVSDDGNTWTQVADGRSSGATEGLELVDIGASGRYIKFLGGGNTDNGHSNILEFKVFE